MKAWQTIVMLLLAIGLGILIGKYSFKNETVVVGATINTDSLRATLLAGTISSATYEDLYRRYGITQQLLDSLRSFRPGVETVTVSTPPPQTPVKVASIDTALVLHGSIAIAQEGDTTYVKADIPVTVDISYLGDPLNLFAFDNMAIHDLHLSIPVRKRVYYVPEDPLFSLMGMSGWQKGRPMLGGGLEFTRVGAGIMLSPWSSPVYYISYRMKIL